MSRETVKETRVVNWKKELADLIAMADTDEDKKATEAFANVIRPYLDDPTMLRTLLGKIQAPIAEEALELVVSKRTFLSLDDLKKQVPDQVRVITL